MTLRRTILFAVPVLALAGAAWAIFGPSTALEAPQAKSYTVGLISNNPNGLKNVEGFRAGLQQLGYVDGENTTFLFAGGPTPKPDLEAAIREMVDQGADLIFTAGTPTGVAAHAATRESGVPVVFGVIADPVRAGVLADLSRPGGNLTGIMLSQNQARRMEVLHELLPEMKTVLLPYNPTDAAPVSAAEQLDAVAAELGITVVHGHARNNEEVTALLENLPEDLDAIFMLPDSTVNRRIADLIAAADARQIPVAGPSMVQAEAGALMSYGIVHREVGVQASEIARRILQGADVSNIPVQTANFYFVLNVAAAERLGLDLADADLRRADFILREDRLSP